MKRNTFESLMKKVAIVPESGCWLWLGSLSDRGYGEAAWNGRMRRAHRVMFELHGGELKQGLELDHVCRVRCCVNPRHLEQVSHAENMRRSPVIQQYHAYRKTKPLCKHGHARTPENILRDRRGLARCRECNVLRLTAKRRKQGMQERRAA